MPIIRIGPNSPNRVFEIGSNAGFGIDIRIYPKIILKSNTGVYFVTERTTIPSHFGPSSVMKSTEKVEYLSLGISYLITLDER
jgi:trans-2-enoyl-CoA reductase